MATATTTMLAIRQAQEALINALEPSSLAQVPFRPLDRYTDIDDWAETEQDACFRRYQIVDVFDDEEITVSDGYTQDIESSFDLLIAYPLDSRYGDAGLNECIRNDIDQINQAIGVQAFGDYPAGQHLCLLNYKSTEKLDSVVLVTVNFDLSYRKQLLPYYVRPTPDGALFTGELHAGSYATATLETA